MKLTPAKHTQKTPLIDEIVAIRDDLLNSRDAATPVIIPGELSEAFTLLDPDLAYLHKDMRSAAIQLSIAQKSGQMVDMAKWRFETAESAYQTRLMEVRKNKKFEDAAKMAMVDGGVKAQGELRNSAMQEEMNRQFNQRRLKKIEEKRRREEKEGGWFFYMMLGLWLATMNAQRRAHEIKMSRLQNDFFNARTGTAV